MTRSSLRLSSRSSVHPSIIQGDVRITYLNGETTPNAKRRSSSSKSVGGSKEPSTKIIKKEPVSTDQPPETVVKKEEVVKIEYEPEPILDRAVTPDSLPEPLSPSSSRKGTPRKAALLKAHPAPKRWREQLAAIQEMRHNILPPAPVDTMGCDSLPDGVVVPPIVSRYQTLTALMLSSQTKDPVTASAMQRLRQELPGGLTVQTVLAAAPETINECICKVGFHNRKTIYIKQTAEILRDEFDYDIPKTVEELCCLPGVGPKMAYLAMQCAWSVNAGIGVDTHVHRITNRLRWHKPPTTDPEMTRINLESWLPNTDWKSINWLLVGFGQLICQPIGPKCGSCKLAEEGLCPSAGVKKRAVTITKIEEVKIEGNEEKDTLTVKVESQPV